MTPKHSLLAVLVVFASCGQKDDIKNAVDHAGSIETSISVQHADSLHDVVLTTHKVWTNGKLYATIVHRDTVPGLGPISANAENGNGDSKTVTVPRDYQIFITMK